MKETRARSARASGAMSTPTSFKRKAYSSRGRRKSVRARGSISERTKAL